MYFPLLRGKQYELLALRELAPIFAESQNLISPIIEPVRKSFSTFNLSIAALKDKNINFNIILNPIVGDLKDNWEIIKDSIELELKDYNNFQFTFYIDKASSINLCREIHEKISIESNGYTFIHLTQIDGVNEVLSDLSPNKYNLIHSSKTSRRYYRNFISDTTVTLDDYFNILSRNSDYGSFPDEPFSEEHLYYAQDGYTGFADYLTVGESFSTGGFLPYAVVIHFTYSDDNNKIRIKHFVSDSNDDTSDVAGKYFEALTKLVNWLEETTISTIASGEFRKLYVKQHFPGLGVLKKLSIMNHLELVLNLLRN